MQKIEKKLENAVALIAMFPYHCFTSLRRMRSQVALLQRLWRAIPREAQKCPECGAKQEPLKQHQVN